MLFLSSEFCQNTQKIHNTQKILYLGCIDYITKNYLKLVDNLDLNRKIFSQIVKVNRIFYSEQTAFIRIVNKFSEDSKIGGDFL